MILHNQIAKSINEGQIEKLITEASEINEAYVENAGSSAKGLIALEYLLFHEEGSEASLKRLNDSAYVAYAVALAENVETKANDLYACWTADSNAYTESFIETDEKTSQIQRTINKLANEIMASTETLINMNLAQPMGLTDKGAAQFDAIEGIRSESAVVQIESNLEILLKTLRGKEGSGFDDYLSSVGAAELADEMIENMQLALDALGAVDRPLVRAVTETPEAIEEAYNASKCLLGQA